MGLLIKGQWHTNWYDTASHQGEFIRQESQFRQWITPQSGPYPAAKNRYHLYVSLACPWAHRTLIFRHLKGLDDIISVSAVKPEMLEKGWEIDHHQQGPIDDAKTIADVYIKNQPDYSGRVTVPILWDKQTNKIISNESADIIRMLNHAFNELTSIKTDYYPESLRPEIDQINDFIYDRINNGVYKVGFATTQQAYEKHFARLFKAFTEIDHRLSQQRYLIGNIITEADWRLFTTLIRFDAVYVGHFKCNLKRIADFNHLQHYLCDLYQQPGIATTTNFDHIKKHYYFSHDTINPSRIIPVGPELNFNLPHDRERFDV